MNINHAVYYSVDALAEAGLPAPAEGWNWATFLDYCKKTTHRSPDGKTDKIGFSYFHSFIFPWLLQNGARDFVIATQQWFPDREKSIEAIQFAAELQLNGLSGSVSYDRFIAGDAAMLAEGNYVIKSLRTLGPDFDFGSIHWPSQGHRGIYVTGYALHITDSQDPKRIAAAWEYIKWLTAVPQQLRYAFLTGQVPSVLRAVQDPQYMEVLREMPQLRTFIDEAVRFSVPQPNPIGYLDVLTRFVYPRINTAVTGQVSPREAFDQMKREIDNYYRDIKVSLH